MSLMLSCKIISPVHAVEQGKTGRKQNSETQIKLIKSLCGKITYTEPSQFQI